MLGSQKLKYYPYHGVARQLIVSFRRYPTHSSNRYPDRLGVSEFKTVHIMGS